MAASKFFVTVSPSPSWAETGPTIEKARTAQVAAMIVRIFMCFLLPHGRRPCAGPEKKHLECERKAPRTRKNREAQRHGEAPEPEGRPLRQGDPGRADPIRNYDRDRKRRARTGRP